MKIKLIIILLIIGLSCSYCNIEKFTLPRGYWRKKCIIHDYRDPFLWASCENDIGKYIETSISIDKCINKNIKNVNGILECV
jgi:hypothetical protein